MGCYFEIMWIIVFSHYLRIIYWLSLSESVIPFVSTKWWVLNSRISYRFISWCSFFKKYIYLFIWLHQVLVASWRIFMWDIIFVAACGILSCSMWDLFPWRGIEPGPLALEAWSFSHWTTGEVSVSWCSSVKKSFPMPF